MFKISDAIQSLRNYQAIFKINAEESLDSLEWLGDPLAQPTDEEIIAELDALNNGSSFYANCPPEYMNP